MEEAIKKLVNVVYEIYGEIIKNTEKKVDKRVSDQGKIVSFQIIQCMKQILNNNMWRLLNKTFVYEFHRYRTMIGLPADKNSTKAINKYVDKLNRKEIEFWFKRYPVLEKMVRNSIQNTCNYIVRILEDYYKDREELVRVMGIKEDAVIIDLRPMESDPHNNGSVVIFVEFSDGYRVIYKARSLGCDLLIEEIFRKIIVFKDIKEFSPVPKCINKDTHGWVSYIENIPINEAEIGEAFYRLGLYAPIFSCFGATDIHDENIIFSGINPYFIDLETIMQPMKEYNQTILFEKMQKLLLNSIANTSIIPAKLLTRTLNYLIGAINTPYPQKAESMVFSFRNIGTDAIDIAKEKVTIDRLASPIKLDSKKIIDPIDYMNEFIRGYRKGYLKIISNRRKIKDLLIHFNEPLRIVLRPTTQYYMILDACLFPENLTSEDAVKKILEYLKPLKVIEDPEEARKILNEEWKALLLGEIPYFYIEGNERRITINGYTSSQIYKCSPIENALENLDSISEKRLMLDERLIVEGYSEIKNKNSKINKKIYESESEIFRKLWNGIKNSDVNEIYDFYNQLAIKTWNNGKIEAGWIGGMYGDLPISYNSLSLISFHDTGGIPVMIKDLAYFVETKNEYSDVNKYWQLYNEAINGIKSQKKYISERGGLTNISIISGMISLEILQRFNESERKKVIENFLKDNMKTKLGDIYDGKLGIYLYLASCEETDIDLMKEADREITEAMGQTFEKKGIAHGKLGLFWAKFRINRFLDNIEVCKDVYKKVQEIAELEVNSGNGWCNGNSGILMILAEMLTMPELRNIPRNFLKEFAAITVRIPEDKIMDLSICHGVAGVIQSLIFCFLVYEEKIYLDIAEEYWEKN